MKYTVKSLDSFTVIGFEKSFSYEQSHALIPLYWDEVFEKHASNILRGNAPATPQEWAIVNNRIGTYGICIDDASSKSLRYLIAGEYQGGEVPEGMSLVTLEKSDWAIFDCVGPIPEALQALTDEIFNKWLPNNSDYEVNGYASVEWYAPDIQNKHAEDTHSAVWVPVKKK